VATITFKGQEIHTNGELPAVGSKAPEFRLVSGELHDISLSNYKGLKKLINVVQSLDTDVCAVSTKKFNDFAKDRKDVVVLVISADLPFAQIRFCTGEEVNNVVSLSTMRSPEFARDYGVLITDGPMQGFTARAVLVLDENDTVVYRELVPETTQEPDYQKAIEALESLSKK
jgi:thioredoxin-dependent peroxiredoxin